MAPVMDDFWNQPRKPSAIDNAVDDYFFDPLQHLLTGKAHKGYEDGPITVNPDGSASGGEAIYHDPMKDGGGSFNPLNQAAVAKDAIFSWFAD